MNLMNSLLITSIIITTNAFSADASLPDAIAIKKDTPAPFSGILLTHIKAQEVEKDLIDLDGTKSLNDSLQKSLDISQKNYTIETQKTAVLLNRNDALAKQVESSEATTNFERVVWVVLGIGLGILSGIHH